MARLLFCVCACVANKQKENLTRKEDSLNATQIRRGVYLNTGSKDAGVDKDWDFYTNTWRGRRAGDVVRKPKSTNATSSTTTDSAQQ